MVVLLSAFSSILYIKWYSLWHIVLCTDSMLNSYGLRKRSTHSLHYVFFFFFYYWVLWTLDFLTLSYRGIEVHSWQNVCSQIIDALPLLFPHIKLHAMSDFESYTGTSIIYRVRVCYDYCLLQLDFLIASTSLCFSR